MNVQTPQATVERSTTGRFRYPLADVDIHPRWNSHVDLYPYMEKRWQTFLETYGAKVRHGVEKGSPYPASQPEGSRRDAWPEGGGRAASELGLMQRQHLDANHVEIGVLTPLGPGGFMNPGLAEAYCHALNQWQVDYWTSNEPRLKASIMIPYDYADLSVKEIELRAPDLSFVQVFMMCRTAEPLGQRRYWPIYEAAARNDIAVGVHTFGQGSFPYTANGWPSHYIEEMQAQSATCQAAISSLVMEGVFEEFPNLRVLLTEAGIAWLPSLMWRMDKHWERLRSETPHLKRPPSEYIREHIWLSTQPIEEPEPRDYLFDTIEWMGWDRICFSSDYPHWDSDDPMFAMPLNKMTEEQRSNFLIENARRAYRGRV